MKKFRIKQAMVVLILIGIFSFSLMFLINLIEKRGLFMPLNSNNSVNISRQGEVHSLKQTEILARAEKIKKKPLKKGILDRIDEIKVIFMEKLEKILDLGGGIEIIPKKGVYDQKFEGLDLRNMNLSSWKKELETSSFDTRTKWPSPSKLPPGFNPTEMIEKGKYPGLDLKKLHQQGFTGKGVNIAIIDHRLANKYHIEYRRKLKHYEEIVKKESYEMHGPLVTSMLIGGTTGTAPEANLHYFGTHWGVDISKSQIQINTAKALKEIIAFNKKQPPEKRIRLVSISFGFPFSGVSAEATKEWNTAFKEAQREGIIVVTTRFDMLYWLGLKDKWSKSDKFLLWPIREGRSLDLRGARCPWIKDRDNPLNYDKSYFEKWWDDQEKFINATLVNSKTWQEFKEKISTKREELLKPTGSAKWNTSYTVGLARTLERLPVTSTKFKTPFDYLKFKKSLPPKHSHQIWIPIGDRTAASKKGRCEYLFMGDGGLSSAIPYYVGAMALVLQVNPKLSNRELIKIMDQAVTALPNGMRLISPEKAVKLAKESLEKE